MRVIRDYRGAWPQASWRRLARGERPVGIVRQADRPPPDCGSERPVLWFRHALSQRLLRKAIESGRTIRPTQRRKVMNQRILSMTTIGALVASLAVVGCSKTDQQGANGSGSTAPMSEQKSTEGTEAPTGMDKAKDATAKMGDKIDDAMITTSVKTELAKDASLSALSINVDTADGRVALKGTAPTAAAKEQATTLAQNVKGVLSVDNQLTIKQ
jgi:hyperosmotically inducible periplasmic protein